MSSMPYKMTDLEMLGETLRMIRIRANYTLRDFCLRWKLDVVRFSMIERGLLKPTKAEVNRYLMRVKDKRYLGYKNQAIL